MKQKFYGRVNKRHDDYMDDEDYEWENADKVFWDEESHQSKWHLPLYKIGEEQESRSVVSNRSPTVISNRSPTVVSNRSPTVVNNRSPTVVNNRSPSNSLLNLLDDEPIPTLFDTQERLTLVDDDDTIPTLVDYDYDTHERPTLVDDTPLKKRRIDDFQMGGKKRTHKKGRHTKRTHTKRRHTKRRHTKRRHTNKSRKFKK